jgi:hypothetical protein
MTDDPIEALMPFLDDEVEDSDKSLDKIRTLSQRILLNMGLTKTPDKVSDVELDAIELATLIHEYYGWDIK